MELLSPFWLTCGYWNEGESFARGARKFSELYLVLLIVVTSIAAITSELPGILDAYKVSVSPSGSITLEAREDSRLKQTAFSPTGKDGGGGANKNDLNLLKWAHGLMERDVKYVCALANKETTPVRPCLEAGPITKYKRATPNTTKPVFMCMVGVADELKNRELTSALIRPFATAYMHAILTETYTERLNLSLVEFGRELEENYEMLRIMNDRSDCKATQDIIQDLNDSNIDLAREIESAENSGLPYGYMISAILTDFFGDTAGSIMMLQKWEDRHRTTPEDKDEAALRVWSGYVVRSLQNFLITGIQDNTLRIAARSYDEGALHILKKFRMDFVARLNDEKYCTGDVNKPLMLIYYLHIQESQDQIEHIFWGSDEEIFSVFKNHTIHDLAKVLTEYEKLRPCFDKVLEGADYYYALTHERLGDYELRYADHIENWERSLHSEDLPRQLCHSAHEHFRKALTLMTQVRKQELSSIAAKMSQRTEMLDALLSGRLYYKAEAMVRRLSDMSNDMRDRRMCER